MLKPGASGTSTAPPSAVRSRAGSFAACRSSRSIGSTGRRIIPQRVSSTINLNHERPDPWDTYAPFYDWENARTLGRRDVPFWRRVAAAADGRVLELGCGTGRVTVPLAKAGIDIVGVDLSAQMLKRLPRDKSRSQPILNRPPRI